MSLNYCLEASELPGKEFLRPEETELALISKFMCF